MPLVTYHKIVSKYRSQELTGAILKVAKMCDSVLVHRSFLSRQAREKYNDKQIMIGRELYFCLHQAELPRRARIGWNGQSIIQPTKEEQATS